ncbi:hypothetical protein [Pseudofrankia asymbiotica]|uniref:Uncharacterized protein n=1 Tax=Pseudofrankia asymbiotica TaxID=1834516 RepID=A0A1V2IB47_9ACTN|nr:hypothetical protein [Pseudofrankia asymbiotica]ONH30315.1 hypothetical protein BL253_14295 [Pseudofrankia asymbiotica]
MLVPAARERGVRRVVVPLAAVVPAAAARDEVPRAAGRAAAGRAAAERVAVERVAVERDVVERVPAARAAVERVAVERAGVERVAGEGDAADVAVRVGPAGLLPSGLAVVVRAFDGIVVPLSAQAAATVDYA